MQYHFGVAKAARLTGLEPDRLKRYAKQGGFGFVENDELRFQFQDLLLLRTVRDMRNDGVPAQRIRKAIDALRQEASSEAALLSSLRLQVHGKRVVASRAGVRWDVETGQRMLGFDSRSQEHGEAIALFSTDDPEACADGTCASAEEQAELTAWAHRHAHSADDWIEVGLSWEDIEPQRAFESYWRALSLEPNNLLALINLGRLCAQSDETDKAIAYLTRATQLDRSNAIAHFNLGLIYQQVDELQEAAGCYGEALRCDPRFADAYYQLATLHEAWGDLDGAERQRQAFIGLSTGDRPPLFAL